MPRNSLRNKACLLSISIPFLCLLENESHNVAVIYLTTQLFWSVCLHADQSIFEEQSLAVSTAKYSQTMSWLLSAVLAFSLRSNVPGATFIPHYMQRGAWTDRRAENVKDRLAHTYLCVFRTIVIQLSQNILITMQTESLGQGKHSRRYWSGYSNNNGSVVEALTSELALLLLLQQPQVNKLAGPPEVQAWAL